MSKLLLIHSSDVLLIEFSQIPPPDLEGRCHQPGFRCPVVPNEFDSSGNFSLQQSNSYCEPCDLLLNLLNDDLICYKAAHVVILIHVDTTRRRVTGLT